MKSIFPSLALSYFCLSVFPEKLLAGDHLTDGMLDFGGVTVGVNALVGKSADIDMDSVDLHVTYDLTDYMAQLRYIYAGIQTFNTCGDRVIFNPPQLMLVKGSTGIAIGSRASAEDWTCSSFTRDEQHGLKWTKVDELQRSRTATTASMDYSVSLMGTAAVQNPKIEILGNPTRDSIIAMENLAAAVSSDVSGAAENMTWWDASAETTAMVASRYGLEEYEAFLEAFANSEVTIDGDTIRLTMEMNPALAAGWATFIAAGPQALADQND